MQRRARGEPGIGPRDEQLLSDGELGQEVGALGVLDARVGAEVGGEQPRRFEDALGDVVEQRRVAAQHPHRGARVEARVVARHAHAHAGGALHQRREREQDDDKPRRAPHAREDSAPAGPGRASAVRYFSFSQYSAGMSCAILSAPFAPP